MFFFQAEDGIRDLVRSRGLGDVYKRQEHTITGDSNFALVATFLPKPNTGGYEYKFVLVKNLAHNYPNGVFHPFDAPKIHWNWMKQYSLDESTSAKTLTVNNGYGDGYYEKDEKIHVRSEQQDLSLIHISEPTRPY